MEEFILVYCFRVKSVYYGSEVVSMVVSIRVGVFVW